MKRALAVAVVAAALIDLVPPRLGPGVRNPEATPAGAATQPIPTVLTGPPHALAAFHVSVMPGQEKLQLQWSYATTSPHVDELNLALYTVVRGVPYIVARTAVGNTVEGDTYTIPMPVGSWLVKATPQNNAGYGPESTSPVMTVTNPCHGGDLCVTATPVSHPATVRLAGEGFLLSAPTSGGKLRNASAVTPLDPRQWRFSGSSSDPGVRGVHASRTQILSDLWNNTTAPGNDGYARTPWSNWGAWQNFVEQTVRTAERQGWAPDYWDVWNEPNGTCCPKFSPADQHTISVSRWLETYELAWQAIKAVDKNAKVIGPSLSALQWAPGSPAEFDLDTFLAFSTAHHLRWDAISWHENTSAPSPGDMWTAMTNVDHHIAMAKAVMAKHPGTVAGNTIMINEYDAADTHLLAGWSVGFFTAFENDGVQQANLACWTGTDCTTYLDGLLTPAGATTAAWWAHRLYTELGGEPRLAVNSTADWQVSGLATRDDKTHTVRVLLGRHWTCNNKVNAWCTNPQATVPAASVALTINWPYGRAPASVTVQRVPAGTGAVYSVPSVHATVKRVSASQISVVVPGVQDGDALWVVAHSG